MQGDEAERGACAPQVRGGLPNPRPAGRRQSIGGGASRRLAVGDPGQEGGDPGVDAVGAEQGHPLRATVAPPPPQRHADPAAEAPSGGASETSRAATERDRYARVLQQVERELAQGLGAVPCSPAEAARRSPAGQHSAAHAFTPRRTHTPRPASPAELMTRARREEQALAALQFSAQLDDMRRAIEREAAERMERARRQTEEEYVRWKQGALDDLRRVRRELEHREEELHHLHTKLHVANGDLETLRRDYTAALDREHAAARISDQVQDSLRRLLLESQAKDTQIDELHQDLAAHQEANVAAQHDREKLRKSLSDAVQELRRRIAVEQQLKRALDRAEHVALARHQELTRLQQITAAGGAPDAAGSSAIADTLVLQAKVEAMAEEITRLRGAGRRGDGASEQPPGSPQHQLHADLARLAQWLRGQTGAGEDHSGPRAAGAVPDAAHSLAAVRECCRALLQERLRLEELARSGASAVDAGRELAETEGLLAAAQREVGELRAARKELAGQLAAAEKRAAAADASAAQLRQLAKEHQLAAEAARAEAAEAGAGAEEARLAARLAEEQVARLRSEVAGRPSPTAAAEGTARLRKELEAELQAVAAERGKCNQQVEEAAARCEALEQHSAELRREVVAAEAGASDTARQLAEAQAAVSGAQEREASLVNENGDLLRAQRAAEAARDAAEKRLGEAEQRAAAAEAARLDAEARIAAAAEADDGRRQQDSEAAGEAERLRGELLQLRSRCAELEQAAGEAARLRSEQDSEAAVEAERLRGELQQLQSRCADLEQAAGEATRLRSEQDGEAAGEAERLRGELQQLQSRCADMEKTAGEAVRIRSELQGRCAVLEAAADETKTLRGELSRTRVRCIELQQAAEDASDELCRVQDQLKESKAPREGAADSAALEAELAALLEEKLTLVRTSRALAARCRHLQDGVLAASARVAEHGAQGAAPAEDLSEEVEKLRRQLEEKTARVQEVKRQLMDKNRAYNELETKAKKAGLPFV